MNLKEKELLIGEYVAYPSVDEYGFTGGEVETKRILAEAVNRILAAAFQCASAENPAFEQIVRLVYKPLKELQQRYYDIGLCAPNTYCAIARFWGLNYCPEIYSVMRFPPETIIQATDS